MTAVVKALYDTNILLYAVDTAPASATKRAKAIELMQATDYGVSAQVLAEFFYNATRKLPTPLPAPLAQEFIASLVTDQAVVPIDVELVLAGIALAQRYQLSYWDGAILAAAQRLGATVVYSEDLSHGQTYGSVLVINPFR
jgi:predicted nucleic acid-binding protein